MTKELSEKFDHLLDLLDKRSKLDREIEARFKEFKVLRDELENVVEKEDENNA